MVLLVIFALDTRLAHHATILAGDALFSAEFWAIAAGRKRKLTPQVN
jgi:hypothetical protein